MAVGAGAAAGPQADDPLTTYRRLRREGRLKPDPAQELAIEKLQALHRRLAAPRPKNGGLLARFVRRRPVEEEAPAQGLYLYGDVGRGKSMLMDLFFDTAPVERKRRVHFHAFMLEVHAAIHRFRQSDASRRQGDDPIPPVAAAIAEGAELLCFDEFQVTDVADAMILARLFEQLFEREVVVLATSNRAPDELYLGGLNRPLFLPFIALLQQKLDVLHLAGAVDHRLARLKSAPVYHTPLGPEATRALDDAFAALTEGARPTPYRLNVQGRELVVPAQGFGTARFPFAELCERPLGAADYLELAARYHTLVLDGVPRLGPEKRNEAKRFVTLIDALYEAKVKLVCSAAAAPQELYPEGHGSFEFARTASRLIEMQSLDYLALPHAARTTDAAAG